MADVHVYLTMDGYQSEDIPRLMMDDLASREPVDMQAYARSLDDVQHCYPPDAKRGMRAAYEMAYYQTWGALPEDHCVIERVDVFPESLLWVHFDWRVTND